MEQTEKQLTEPTAQTAQPEQAATEQATQPDTKEERGNAAFAAMRRAKESAEKQVKALSEEHADTEALRAERDQELYQRLDCRIGGLTRLLFERVDSLMAR